MSFGLIFIMITIQFLSVYLDNRILMNDRNFSISKAISLIIVISIGILIYTYLGVFVNIYIIVTNGIFNYQVNRRLLPSVGLTSLVAITNFLADHLISSSDTLFSIQEKVPYAIYIILHLFFSFVLALLLTLIFKKIIQKFLPRGIDSREGHVVSFVMLFTYIIYMLCVLLGVNLGNTPELIQLNLIFFLIYLIFLLVSFFFYSKSLRKELQVKQKEVENQAIRQYTEDLEKQYSQMRKFRHDYQNVLSSLDSFVQEKDFSGLTEYYQHTIRPSANYLQENHFKLSDLSNLTAKEVKSLIASKLMYAQEIGINASLEAREPIGKLNFDSLALIRILGIFLDNAIEALEELDTGQLRVAFIPFENNTQIIIENTCQESIPALFQLKKNGFSTKGEQRGLGLSNVDELLRENDREGTRVSLETIIKDGKFTQILTISNLPKEE